MRRGERRQVKTRGRRPGEGRERRWGKEIYGGRDEVRRREERKAERIEGKEE